MLQKTLSNKFLQNLFDSVFYNMTVFKVAGRI